MEPAKTLMSMQPGKGGNKTQTAEVQVFGKCALSCVCQGHCFLPRPPSRATVTNSTGEAGGGDSVHTADLTTAEANGEACKGWVNGITSHAPVGWHKIFLRYDLRGVLFLIQHND